MSRSRKVEGAGGGDVASGGEQLWGENEAREKASKEAVLEREKLKGKKKGKNGAEI